MYELPWDGKPFDTQRKVLAFDTETTVTDDPEVIPTFVLATATDGERVVVIHPDQLEYFVRHHQTWTWYGFNWAFDWWVVNQQLKIPANVSYWREFVEKGLLIDAMILDQLVRLALNEDTQKGIYPRNLDVVSRQYTGVVVDKNSPYRMRFGELLGMSPKEWIHVADQGFFDYATHDAVSTFTTTDRILHRAKLVQQQFDPHYEENVVKWGPLSHHIQLKGALALAQVRRNGIYVDQKAVKGLYDLLTRQLQDETNSLHLMVPGSVKGRKNGQAGHEIKINHSVLQEHLSDETKGLPTSDKTKKVSLKTKGLANKLGANHPVVRVWSDLTDVRKTLQFVVPLLGKKKIHPRYNNLVKTGRTSASSEDGGGSIQQQPKEDWFRKIYVPRPGHKMLAIDYSAIELRTLAAVCLRLFGWSRLAEVLKAGLDPHVATAASIGGQTYEDFQQGLQGEYKENYKKSRQAAKAINFGVPGGLGPDKLARYAKENYRVDLSTQEADAFRTKLVQEVYPEIGKYLKQDTFEQMAKNVTSKTAIELRELWYGPQEMQDLRDFVGGEEWDLWMMEKVVRGNPTTRKGKPYPDWIVNKTWDFLDDLSASLSPELQDLVRQRQTGEKLHLALFGGSVVTNTGRVRGGVKFTEAKNTPFQGLAADGAKLALWEEIINGLLVVTFVHDEMVFDIKDEKEVDLAVLIAKEQMARVLDGVPVEAAYKVGDYWSKP